MDGEKSCCTHFTCPSQVDGEIATSRSYRSSLLAFVKKGNFCKPQPGMRSAGVIWASDLDGFRHRLFGS